MPDGPNYRSMGALPATGGWVRLEVPAALIGLEGVTVACMALALYNGRAAWDRSGVIAADASTTVDLYEG